MTVNEKVSFTDYASGICNISHNFLWPSQFLENIQENLEWSTLQKQISPTIPPPPSSHPALNVEIHWLSSNIEACAKKLSQILANNIDSGRDWSQNWLELLSKKINERQKGVWNNLAFFSLNSLFLMFGLCQRFYD